MQALRWHAREDLRIDELTEPWPRPGEVLIDVAWCGICGTDLHEYLAGPDIITTTPHPSTGQCAPVTIGHEFSGTIVGLGAGVKAVREGQRVTVDPCLSCGTCWYCRTGELVRCEAIAFVGMHCDGAMAKLVRVPASLVHVLPDEVSDEAGALLEPLTVGLRAVRRSSLRAGDTATVVGAGPIGLMTLAALRAAGAAEIYVVERSPARKAMALEMGATQVFDPAEGDSSDQVLEVTAGGRGTDVSFECVGLDVTFSAALRATRRGGTTVVLGLFGRPAQVQLNDVLLAERTVVGSAGSVADFPRATALVADGRVDVTPMVTGRLRLENAISDGFRALVASRDENVKVLVSP